MSPHRRCSRPLSRLKPATALERFREDDLAAMEGRTGSALFAVDLGRACPGARAHHYSDDGLSRRYARQPVDRTFARRPRARATASCAAPGNCFDYLDFIAESAPRCLQRSAALAHARLRQPSLYKG